MAFSITSLPDLITRTTNDLISRLELNTAVPGLAVVRFVAKAWSNCVVAIQFMLQWVSKQFFISQCDDATLPQHGVDLGMPQLAATFATGPVVLVGTATTPIPALTPVQSEDQVQYVTTVATAIGGGGTVTVNVVAQVAGASGNLVAGAPISLVSAISGVSSSGTVGTGGIVNGFDAETNDAYRARMLYRVRNRPQGGADADYVEWAESVYPNMRAWVRPQWMGPGTVGVLFVLDGQTPSILPSDDQCTAVYNYICTPGGKRRPVTAQLFALGPSELLPIDLSIKLVPDSDDGRASAILELQDLLYREAEPGICPALGEMAKAAGNATGVDYATIPTPTVEFAPTQSQLPVLGTITWITS